MQGVKDAKYIGWRYPRGERLSAQWGVTEGVPEMGIENERVIAT